MLRRISVHCSTFWWNCCVDVKTTLIAAARLVRINSGKRPKRAPEVGGDKGSGKGRHTPPWRGHFVHFDILHFSLRQLLHTHITVRQIH